MSPAQQFLKLAPDRRQLAFEQAATIRGLHPAIIGKDFWVCWLLGVLYSAPELGAHVVFKGGTSLSKVYGVIDRFSEDIDLSLSPAFVGADAAAFDALTSRARRDAAITEMQQLCTRKADELVIPVLERALRELLGEPRERERWLSFELDERAKSPIVFFHYPVTTPAGVAYLRPTVKLELGSLTDQQPVGLHPVRPWVADAFPAVFGDWHCEVVALDLARSFWEKATILHAEHHRPADQLMPDRYARHYSDTARLIGHRDAPAFLVDKALASRVAEWKSRVFARAWARYDLARHGTFQLVPPPLRLSALAADYAAMRPMFLNEPPPFEQVIAELAVAEQTINSMGS